jgi:kumamolisin
MLGLQEKAVLSGSSLPEHLLQVYERQPDSDQILRVTLRLEPRCGLEAVLAHARELGRQIPADRAYLRRDKLAEEIGPSTEAVRAVEEFCRQQGFTLERTAIGGLFVTISGKAGDLAHAFGVELGVYRQETRSIRAYEGSLSLPAELTPHVRAVLGLDEVSHLAATREDKADFLEPPSINGNLPTTVAFDYYQYPQHVTGRGATVAFIEDNLLVDLENIQAFFAHLGLGHVNVILAEGEPGAERFSESANSPRGFNGEAMMDLKLTGAVAPGATLVAYGLDQSYGFSSDHWVDALLAALESPDNPCNIISISLGGPESNWSAQVAQSIDALFGIAGLYGATICVASGDFGAPGNPKGHYTQNCAFPASSPFCLACGGTELVLEEQDGQRILRDEVVWNEMKATGQKAATGGGISTLFPVPDFQQGLTLPTPLNPGQQPGRGLPDVASNAARKSGYALSPAGTGNGYGTSAAAPMWAALIALIIEESSGTLMGYITPVLYALELWWDTSCCRPITEGSNGPPGSSISFSAGTPWNACCGLGSPLGSNLAAALVSATKRD